jgi:hypothetical protein
VEGVERCFNIVAPDYAYVVFDNFHYEKEVFTEDLAYLIHLLQFGKMKEEPPPTSTYDLEWWN